MRRRAIAIGTAGFGVAATLLILALANVERTTLAFLAALAWLAGTGGILAALLQGQRRMVQAHAEILRQLDRLPGTRDLNRLPKLEDIERLPLNRELESQLLALRATVEASSKTAVEASNKAAEASNRAAEASKTAVEASNKAAEASNEPVVEASNKAAEASNRAAEASNRAVDAIKVGNRDMQPAIHQAVSEANEALMWAIDARLVGITEQAFDRGDAVSTDEVS